MRKCILNLHLYGGLLCSAYLIIFGWSSLCFNHRSLVVGSEREPVTWEQPLTLTAPADNAKAADAVRDALGLMGWPLPWKMNRDAEGNLHFDMERPGKSDTVHALFKEGKARIEARPKKILSVVNSLHAIMDLPNSHFVRFWGYYTEIGNHHANPAQRGDDAARVAPLARLRRWLVLSGLGLRL